jgi:hypothetical protein
MELIRESLMYKNNNLEVCMNTLTPQEHYELLRLIMATRKKVFKYVIVNVINIYDVF